MFTNRYISHIAACNSTQTFEFEYHITCLNSYASQIWRPPYVDHSIEKYQVTLAIVMQNTCFSILYLVGVNMSYENNQDMAINIKKGTINKIS